MSSTGYTMCMKGYTLVSQATDELDCAPIVLVTCGSNQYLGTNNTCISCSSGCTFNSVYKVCECNNTSETPTTACNSTCQAARAILSYSAANGYCTTCPSGTTCTLSPAGLRSVLISSTILNFAMLALPFGGSGGYSGSYEPPSSLL